MKTQKRLQISLILALAGIMLAVVVWVLGQMPERPLIEQATFREKHTGQRLVPAYDEAQDRYVLYLPAHVSFQDIQPQLRGGWIQSQYQENQLTLTVWSLAGKQTHTLALQPCPGLPSLFIEAEGETLSYIHESKDHEKQTLVLLRDETGELVFSQAATLSGRGNSSWDNQAKRPYELKFDSPLSFGPFENVRRICLMAEYADESKLHNSIAYYAAREMEADYASGYTYANVYFSGEYLGLYGIATKDAYKQYVTQDRLSGVFEISGNPDRQDFRPMLTRNPVCVMYGNVDRVAQAVQRLEEALLSGDWNRCTAILDVDSFARKYVLEELFCNSDMTFASQYYYLDASGLIHCMLPWDYDLSMGYAFRYYNDKQLYEIESYKDPDGWYALLALQPQFRRQVLSVLEEIRADGMIDRVRDHMEQTAARIHLSWESDILRWRNERPFNHFDLSCGEESLEDMVRLYGQFLPQRLDFLIEHFRNWEDQCRVEFIGDQYGNLCIPKGDNLWDYLTDANILRGEAINPDFKGWFTEDGRQPQDISTVTGDIQFIARYE